MGETGLPQPLPCLAQDRPRLPPPLSYCQDLELQSCSWDPRGPTGTVLAWRGRAQGVDHGRVSSFSSVSRSRKSCSWGKGVAGRGGAGSQHLLPSGRKGVLPHRSRGPVPPPQCLHCLLATHFPTLSHPIRSSAIFITVPINRGVGCSLTLCPGYSRASVRHRHTSQMHGHPQN